MGYPNTKRRRDGEGGGLRLPVRMAFSYESPKLQKKLGARRVGGFNVVFLRKRWATKSMLETRPGREDVKMHEKEEFRWDNVKKDSSYKGEEGPKSSLGNQNNIRRPGRKDLASCLLGDRRVQFN